MVTNREKDKSAHLSQLSKWVRQALWDQGTWIKLSSLSPTTPVSTLNSIYCSELGNWKPVKPPVGFEAESDTVSKHSATCLTTQMKEMLSWPAPSLGLPPRSHGFTQGITQPHTPAPPQSSSKRGLAALCPMHLSNRPTALNHQPRCHPNVGHLVSSLPGPNARMHPGSSSPLTPSRAQSGLFKNATLIKSLRTVPS